MTILFWLIGVPMVLSAFVLLIYFLLRSKDGPSPAGANSETGWGGRFRRAGELAGNALGHPFAMRVGVMIACLIVVMYLIPKLWALIWGDQLFFWFLVLGTAFIIYLRTKKSADAEAVKSYRRNAKLFTIFLVLGLFVRLQRNPYWEGTSPFDFLSDRSRSSDDSMISQLIPASIAGPVIAGCESSGLQFEPGTKTPRHNKERASSAFGKYQFIEAHREAAHKLGYDLNTEEGQDKYFVYRYERFGTRDWEADQRSKDCWQPRLLALAGNNGTMQTHERTISAPAKGEGDKWSEVITIPRGVSIDSRSSGHLIRTSRGEVGSYDPSLPSCYASVQPKNPCLGPSEWAQFQSKTDEEESVTIRFFPYTPTR